ncbi:hypothetical protein KAR91_69945 [Candidatus Pacearchaeota archaeon]|nr:hypothetical protein [Candidatus Pacearchaeota archaeon]
MSESDKDRIKAISIWASNHNKGSKELIPKIALTYLEDLLEYIEDMEYLVKQATTQEIRDRDKSMIRKELDKELSMLKFRAEAVHIEAELNKRLQDHKMKFQGSLYEEENALDYLKVIPVRFILKSLFKRFIWEEE